MKTTEEEYSNLRQFTFLLRSMYFGTTFVEVFVLTFRERKKMFPFNYFRNFSWWPLLNTIPTFSVTCN